MIKIDTNKWYHRWTVDWWVHMPQSICAYFWKVVGTLFLKFSFGIFSIIVPFVTGCVLLYPILQIWFGTDIFLAILSSLLWIFVGNVSLYEYRKFKKAENPEIYNQHTIIGEYIKAKKNKICPLIEYV